MLGYWLLTGLTLKSPVSFLSNKFKGIRYIPLLVFLILYKTVLRLFFPIVLLILIYSWGLLGSLIFISVNKSFALSSKGINTKLLPWL